MEVVQGHLLLSIVSGSCVPSSEGDISCMSSMAADGEKVSGVYKESHVYSNTNFLLRA